MIHILQTNDPYGYLSDTRLSFKTKGIIAFMLNELDCGDFSLDYATSVSTDGRTSIKTGIDEAMRYGYVTKENVREASGVFLRVDYYVRSSL